MSKKTTPKSKPAAKAAAKPLAMTKPQLAATRKKLLEMRDDIAKTVRNQKNVEEPTEMGDPADQASQSIEREILFELSDNERVTLDQVEAAIRKIDKGVYGVCESCRKPIAKARLDALPFARYCISCQNTSESAERSALPTEQPEIAPEFKPIAEES